MSFIERRITITFKNNVNFLQKAGLGLFLFLCLGQSLCVNAQESVFEKDGEVYLIQSAQDMRRLALLVNHNKEVEPGVAAHNASYRLTRDIDLSPYCMGEEGWEPIGYRDACDESLEDILWEKTDEPEERKVTDAGYFNGTFDGGNHVVTGLYINRPKEYGQGLFGQRIDLMKEDPDSAAYKSKENTVIRNLYIKDCDITGKTAGGIMNGMICWGFENNGNLYIENCHVTGKITGTEGAGGVVGDASSVKNSSFSGTINAGNAGGIALDAYYIYGCTVRAEVEGDDGAGGIARSSWCVQNSYMTGSVKGYDTVGGIVGNGACMTGCYIRADVTGYIHTGGLVGELVEDVENNPAVLAVMPKGSFTAATIQNCLMGGMRMERAPQKTDSHYRHHPGYSGYIYGFSYEDAKDGFTSDFYERNEFPFYYREGLKTEGFGDEVCDFVDLNCEPFDCTRLDELDFKELLGKPAEENWTDVWDCVSDYAWPNLLWEKESRFGYTVVVTVQEGDSLWKLAEEVYGDGYFWMQIYEENKGRIGGDANLIVPGTDLEITVNASQADYAAKGDIWEQEEAFLAKGNERGIADAELKSFYRRLLADDLWNGATWRRKYMPEEYKRRINAWVTDDLDGNGQKDMIVIAGDGAAGCPGEIWLYLNEEPFCVLKDEDAYYEESIDFSFFYINPLMADLDNDGNLELLFGVFTDLGEADMYICLFQHVGNRWEEWQTALPDDRGAWAESGIRVSVNTIDTDIDTDSYEAYCPCLDERKEFKARKRSKYFGNTDTGEQMVGGNVRGIYGFQCVDYKGKNALQFGEVLMWEDSSVLGGVIGNAVFILEWDADGVCSVADWWVEGYY